LDEELSNPKGIKEIASAVTALALLRPQAYINSLKQLFAQVLAP